MHRQVVYVVCAEGEESLADRLAEPLKEAGYEVAHNGTLAVGESRIGEAEKAVASGAPIILCATARAIGSAWAHRIINAAHSGGLVRVFVVQMERQAYVEQLALDGKIARYWDDPAQAIKGLIEALAKVFPPNKTTIRLAGEAAPLASTQFLDQPTEVATFDVEALQEFRAQLRDEVVAQYPSTLSPWEFLSRAGLWIEGRLTRTGALLFAKNATAVFPTSMVKCARYYGFDRAAIREMETFDGTVPAQIIKALRFVTDRVRIGEVPRAGQAQSVEVYEYPMVAVREIIANAVVHRDYTSMESCVHVRLFVDRLEVSSPGSWLGRTIDPSIEYPLSSLSGHSIKRNFRLAHDLSWIKLVEGEGTGIPTAINDCANMDNPTPTMKQESGFVTVILRKRPALDKPKASSNQNAETVPQFDSARPSSENAWALGHGKPRDAEISGSIGLPSAAGTGRDSALFDEDARDALCHELDGLTRNATFTVAEFAVDTATIFEISRDEHGTPTSFWWEYRYENGALIVDDDEPDQWLEAMADPEQFYRRVAPKFIVHPPHPLPGPLHDLMPGPRGVPVYQCRTPLRELIRSAMKESPLVLGYELAALKHVSDGHGGVGRLALIGYPLFSQGDTQGAQVAIRVNVEPTDDEGTVFAVVTREQRPELPRQALRMRPVQVQAAVVPPGTYTLTAVLTRPGKVQFQGLPIPLGYCGQSWDDLQRLVPGQLTAQAPVHLVCLVEICGGGERLEQRIYRLEELVTEAKTGARPLYVSVVAYGAHGVAWKVDDRPPEIRAWAASSDEAIEALRGLASRGVDEEREYQRAAQLECALRLVREHLASTDWRPVIVTAGGRPAHPPGLDTSRQLIPCPEWVDGMSELAWLQRIPGATFGALRDRRCRGAMWERLGLHAVATVDDVVDMEGFAARLGLRMAVQTVPFPVIE